MKYSEVKKVSIYCRDLFSNPDRREVLAHIVDNDDDFEVDGVRFINEAVIDSIMCDELSNDEYMLGCFNTGFLADVLDIDYDVIEAMQKAGAYEAIGKLILSLGKLEELQQDYVKYDGYGHHFNHYDGNYDEVTLNGINYLVFDNH